MEEKKHYEAWIPEKGATPVLNICWIHEHLKYVHTFRPFDVPINFLVKLN